MTTPHSTDNYTIGKGKLHVAEWVGTTPPGDLDFEEMGNAVSVEWEPNVERLPHYSSRQNFKLKDKNPVTQMDYTVNFVLDEKAAVNLKRFTMGVQVANVIHGMQATDKEYAIKFESDNPIGPNENWSFWRGTLAPSGPISLIGDEWLQMAYTMEGLADVANHVASPYFDIIIATTTTTSTTTTTTTTTV